MDFREIERDRMDWFELFQDRDKYRALVNIVIKFLVP
jgi:hypothetical protein